MMYKIIFSHRVFRACNPKLNCMKRNQHQRSFFWVLFIALFSTVMQGYAQAGKEGARTVTTANTVLNTYTRVSANAAAGTTTLTVASSALNGGAFAGNLAAGDYIMIMQMQGATINTGNTVDYGSILNYNSAGLYEFVCVASVPNSTTINVTTPLINSYTAAGRTQVVRVPRFTTLTVSGSGSITAPAWNGNTGGIVALETTGLVTLSTSPAINVTGLGFRGGVVENNTSSFGAIVTSTYRSASSNDGAEKGEGIAGFQTEYDGLNGRYGRGAAANGGGGGNGHNAGGGGGANGNNSVTWTGMGNPSTSTANWANAWNLETAGFATSTSSGGGRGGYAFASSNQNALTVAPGNSSWGGDYRDNVGGLGGRPLSVTGDRLFLGGGGGAGDANNDAGGAGGAGGGLVIIKAGGGVTGTGSIVASGNAGGSTTGSHNDAPGGGGGGGSIVIDATTGSVANTITLTANGGAGGNQLITNDESEGPGGGGGGGYIAITAGTPTRNIAGAANGITNSNGVTEFTPNGATRGASGLSTTYTRAPSLIATTAAAGSDITTCPTAITLAGNTPASGVGTWTLVSGPAGSSFANANLATTAVNGAKFGTYVFRWTIVAPNCQTTFDDVTVFAFCNSDNDGLADNIDIDDDNDGIPDVTENGGYDPFADGDSDNIPNYLDTTPGTGLPAFVDANSDGINDAYDADKDGVINSLDLDSDNDGIPDIVEAGGVDTNGDGRVDVFADSDNDGLANLYDVSTGGNAIANADSDGDGIKNIYDLDSDNDGIPDVVETGGTDANGDGRIDGFTDADGDGLSQQVDGDTNNDGTAENTANALLITGPDANSNGVPDSYPVVTDANSDRDNLPNYLDIDSDNDGQQDIKEAGGTDANNDGRVDGFTDTDADGFSQNVDGDTNNDGTAESSTNALLRTGADANNDGSPDTYPNDNIDGTGRPNPYDIDSDDDGLVDVLEMGGTDSDRNGEINPAGGGAWADTDGDGWSDLTDASNGGTALSPGDKDLDGKLNYLDLDSDNDGVLDNWEALFYSLSDPNQDGKLDVAGVFVDTDGDGLGDALDPWNDLTNAEYTPGKINITTTASTPYNADRDGDGLINVYDLDIDNDGIVDNIEGQPTQGWVAPTGLDHDGDGVDNAYDVDFSGSSHPAGYVNTDGGSAADYADTDADNDGFRDIRENFLGPSSDGKVPPGVLDPSEIDANNDGVLDLSAFTDADNDGIADIFDLVSGIGTANNINNNQTPLSMPNLQNPAAGSNRDWREAPDSDLDGITDNIDLDDDNDGILDTVEGTVDTDLDGWPNYLDLDSDNDGIPDVLEAGGSDPDDDGFPGVYNGSTVNSAAYAVLVDANGLPLVLSGTPLSPANFDGDLLPDFLDLDSDNDGIADVVEAFGPTADADGDGQIGAGIFIDIDADGISDLADEINSLSYGGTLPGGTAVTVLDTDADGNANYLDRDSDNDGIADVIEAGGPDADGDGVIGTGPITDTDGDGISDLTDVHAGSGGTPLPTPDSDGDGIVNYLDLDSDNDGITDVIEAGGTDADGNGQIGTGTGTGITDTDNDGLADAVDGAALPLTNTDADARPNYIDIDSDNDGIVDNIEGQSTAGYIAYSATDTDGDGIADAFDNTVGFGGNGLTPVNTDGTGNPDYLDADADDDGRTDRLEGWDTNGNGIIDGSETAYTGTTDADGDGLLDEYDSNDALINPSNGTTPASYPDAQNPGGDKDWRQTLTYVTISGSVINDYDGTKTLTGSETVLNGTNSGGGLLPGAVLYVNMIGPDGKVVTVAPVQADGSYTVTTVPAIAANLEFQLSTTMGVVGNAKPATTLPTGWAATGENKNGYGGAADVVNNAELPFTASTTGFSSFIFGLDRKPVATAQNDLIGVGLDVGETYELDNNPMAATDAEDGTLGTGSTFMITTLPPSADATLNYDGVDITTPNFVITNYDPAKLNIRFNQLGVTSTSFGYTAVDAAGVAGDEVIYNLVLGVVLPATGLQLQASMSSQQVLLQWSTLTEQQTAYFEVELSYNGTSFTKLAQVAAAGNSNTLRKYQYVTGKPAGAQWYYRVKLVDKDGKVSYSNVAVLTGNVNATMVAVLPNPASSKVTVTGLGNAKQLVLTNAAGAIVQRYNVTAPQMELNIASLPDGMYVIRILQSDGSTQVLKLMKR